MKEYRSQTIIDIINQGKEFDELDYIDVCDTKYKETVDLQDLPYATDTLMARVDTAKGIKVLETTSLINLTTECHTIKDLDALEVGFEIPLLFIRIQLTTKREDADDFLEDLKKLTNVKCEDFSIKLDVVDSMTWQQQREVLMYVLPKVRIPIISGKFSIMIGSNRLSFLTSKEKDDDDKKLEELLERVNDKNRTIGSDCLFEV